MGNTKSDDSLPRTDSKGRYRLGKQHNLMETRDTIITLADCTGTGALKRPGRSLSIDNETGLARDGTNVGMEHRQE